MPQLQPQSPGFERQHSHGAPSSGQSVPRKARIHDSWPPRRHPLDTPTRELAPIDRASRASLSDADIPKDHAGWALALTGLFAVLAATAYVVWGFLAPPPDPDLPSAAADIQIPVPE